MNDMSMENNIRWLRKRHNLTLKTLAERIGCSHQQISKLEKGERALSYYWMKEIAKAFSLAPEDIIRSDLMYDLTIAADANNSHRAIGGLADSSRRVFAAPSSTAYVSLPLMRVQQGAEGYGLEKDTLLHIPVPKLALQQHDINHCMALCCEGISLPDARLHTQDTVVITTNYDATRNYTYYLELTANSARILTEPALRAEGITPYAALIWQCEGPL